MLIHKKFAIFLSALILISPAFSSAQEENTDRMERLERQLNILEKEFYKGGAESERRPVQQNDDSSTLYGSASMESRVSQMEEDIRNLRGQIEELSHMAQENREMIEKMNKPYEEQTQNTGGSGLVPLKQNAQGAAPASLAGENAPPANEKAKVQYNEAFDFITKEKFDDAATAFRKFIKENPKDPLLSNAYYWLGETYYVRKGFKESSINFMEGYKADPNGQKAPDNLLKLAMSLGLLNKKDEACTMLLKVEHDFPVAPDGIKQGVAKEKTRLSCK